ncbi:MAG: hypothetical protein AMJ72_05335 [Acidithiobacillales bacterium SM1_46]|nr:MAG: hypothetical protein AMJ72_05335 [Acidithiobacillales bacterium SM1_46]
MATPEEEVGAIETFTEVEDDVIDTDDGGAIIRMEGEDNRPNREWFDNIADDFDDEVKNKICTRLLQDIERDRKAREKREKDYEEAIKRTGLGKETPGGADFEGASKAVHPMLTEAVVDFQSRAIKELMPPNGPVKMYVPGDNPDVDRFRKADRVKNYMNWQFLKQMPDFRTELEQLLSQTPLGGSQYMRLVWDDQKRRPVPQFWPSDDVYIPYAASNFYTSDRVTFVEHITEFEYEQRVRGGMYSDLGTHLVKTAATEEESRPEKATDAVEGKEKLQPFNEDGLHNIYEVNCYSDELEDGKKYSPYRITIHGPSKKICAINRNWEEDDDHKLKLDWAVEFPFIPWRGAGSVGLGQMIGSLSGAATGALRALLDSAHMNNLPTLLRLKGANFSGQSKELNVAAITEVEGGVAGDDIRKLIMPVPFNPPSNVLLELLGVVDGLGRGIVQTTFEKLGEQSTEMPVGTTLALIEEGMTVFSAIHLRMFQAMDKVLSILCRINRMYLDEEELEDDHGELLAYRRDFDPPYDVLPVADPEIFSDVQRMAQLQIIADRAAQMPEIYNVKEVEKRILERTKIPNPDELLLPDDTPEETNAVNENAAMTMGRPVAAFPAQDHLAHLQVHLDYAMSPALGMNPLIAPRYVPMLMGHIVEHVALYYVSYNVDLLKAASGMDDDQFSQMMKMRDPEVRKEMDKTLAYQSADVVPAMNEVLSGLQPIIGQLQQVMQQLQPEEPQPPVDPNAMAAIEQEREADQARDARERERTQLTLVDKREQREHDIQKTFMELDAEERTKALEAARDDALKAQEYAARLEELVERERAEDERTEMKIASSEVINAEDNATALRIAGVKAVTDRAKIKSGEGATNPRPRTDT